MSWLANAFFVAVISLAFVAFLALIAGALLMAGAALIDPDEMPEAQQATRRVIFWVGMLVGAFVVVVLLFGWAIWNW